MTLCLHALIFDLDGTLVDSRLDFDTMRRELNVPAGTGLLEHVDQLVSEEAQRQAMDVIHRHEIAGARAATWIAGAEEVLHALHARGTPTAIVTRNSRAAANLTMERLGMPPIPLMAREDAAPKPDPEALLALAELWGLPPSHCAYVGDFRYDVEAAERAGMVPVLYVGSGDTPPAHKGRVRVLRRFPSLLEWLAADDPAR